MPRGVASLTAKHDQSVVDRNVESRWFARQPTYRDREICAGAIRKVDRTVMSWVAPLQERSYACAPTLAIRRDLSAARRDFNVGPRAIFYVFTTVNSLVIRRPCAFSRRMQRRGWRAG